MTEQSSTAASVEPVAWFARRSTIVVASLTAVALVASIIVGVSASQARAADADALELISASVSDAKAARTSCTAAVAASTASADIATYVTTISDALGADSAAAKAAATTHDKPYLVADCAIAGEIVELNEGDDPSDNVDTITSVNAKAADAWLALASDVKALDTKVSADLAALEGLADANTDYTAALTSLTDALAAAQALTAGDLAVYVTAEQSAALTGARDTATQILDVAVAGVDPISPMSLRNRAATLTEALAALASVVDPINTAATDAKATADAKAAADAAAAAAAQSAKPHSGTSGGKSTGSSSSGSSGTSGSTGGSAGGHIWVGGYCTGADMIKYLETSGWTESAARADSVTRGCTSFEAVR